MYHRASTADNASIPLRSKLQQAIILQNQSLEKKKEKLRQEVRSLERDLKTATQLSFNHNDNSKTLTQCKVFGYFLSSCKIKDLGDQMKQYNACCEDARHPFRISVTTTKDEVTAVNVALSGTSPLNEIRVVLDNLSEDNCPYLVLSTIQQFIHLHNFRLRVIQEKLHSFNTQRGNFQVYSPEFSKERGNHHYIITAQDGAIEIVWTLAWDKVDHGLAHEFSIHKFPQKTNFKRLTNELLSQTFSTRNAHILWDWWTEFCNHVACV